MARIRSTFPGQWTDEDFVACQPLARLLAIGLRNEADDQGVFEWKPLGLKMKLMPVDNVDMNDLLTDLEAHQQVKAFTVNGKAYGAIRNFVKYQKPKKPTKVHPLPTELRSWVRMDLWGGAKKKAGSELDADQQDDGSEPEDGDDGASSEPPPASPTSSSELSRAQTPRSSEPKRAQRPSVPKKSEMAAQREEGGGKRDGEEGSRVVKSSAGGPRARDDARPPPDDPGDGDLEVDGPGADPSDGVLAIRRGVTAAFERWFDQPDRPFSPADDELFGAWVDAGTQRGLSPADSAAAAVEEVQRQFQRLEGKGASQPRSLRAVLDADVLTAIRAAKPVKPSAPGKPPATVPPLYAGHFEAVEYAAWIAPCVVSVADGIATIVAPTRQHRDWVAQRLEPKLRAALGVGAVEVVVAAATPRSAAA